jgi:hypothetical protein
MAEWTGQAINVNRGTTKGRWGTQVLVWDFELDEVPGQKAPLPVHIEGWEFSSQVFANRKYRVEGKQRDGVVHADLAEDVRHHFIVKTGVGIPKWLLARKSKWTGEAANPFSWTETYPSGKTAQFWYFELISEDASERRAARLGGSGCDGQILEGRDYQVSGIEHDGVLLVKEALDLRTNAKVHC